MLERGGDARQEDSPADAGQAKTETWTRARTWGGEGTWAKEQDGRLFGLEQDQADPSERVRRHNAVAVGMA